MDVFAWVYAAQNELRRAGQHRLAQLIDDLPTACLAGRDQDVESMTPEALSLARAVGHPWLEVFIRHWRLQSRVIQHADARKDTLREAVDLLEFAHREDARDCPQSVCVVQDLSSCYLHSDGPGYVEERLAVASETLERIDPSWPCFNCISAEHSSALIDGHRFEDALRFLAAQERATGQRGNPNVGFQRIRALIALGRLDEVLKRIGQVKDPGGDVMIDMNKRLFRCLALARLGRTDEAREHLIGWEEVLDCDYVDWLRCVRELGRKGDDPNTWEMEPRLRSMAAYYSRTEAHYFLTQVYKMGAELAVDRGAWESAQRHIDAAKEQLPGLRAPERIRVRLDELAGRIDRAAPTPPSPDSARSLLAAIGVDPENDLEQLRAGMARWPERHDLTRAAATTLSVLGRDEEAEALLRSLYLRRPDDPESLAQLVEMALQRGDHDRIVEIVDRAPLALVPEARCALARSLRQQGRSREAAACLESLIGAEPEHIEARQMLATVLRDLGDWAGSPAQLDWLVERTKPGTHDWARMLVGTLAGDWSRVRDSARRLDLAIEGEEGPIDQDLGPCRISIRLADGTSRDYLARRTGPVMARIDELGPPEEEQHHRDLVAFDPAPRNQQEFEEAGAEGDPAPLPTFHAFEILESAGFRSFAIDGFHPGASQLADLAGSLEEVGATWQQISAETYMLPAFDDDDVEDPGVFGYVGLPPAVKPETVHRHLLQATSQLSRPLLWPELAREAGDEPTAQEHEATCDQYGIEP